MDPVGTLLKNEAPADGIAIPTVVMSSFQLLHKVHRLWRWHSKATEIYANTDNFKKLVAGHAFHWLVGESLLLRIAAQSTLIVRRLLDTAYQQAAFRMAYRSWSAALTGKTILPSRFPNGESIRLSCTPLSPSTVLWWRWQIYSLALRIEQIVSTTFTFFKEGFKLSMVSLDLVEALALSPTAREEAINELFIHTTKLLDELIANKELLIEELDRHKPLLERVLTQLGSKYSASELTQAVRNSIERTETVYQVAAKVPKGIQYALKEGSYSLLYGTLGWAPRWLLSTEKDYCK